MNYKLSDRITEHMREVGNGLLERRLAHIQSGFPLDFDQVQRGILPQKWRETILEMQQDGFELMVRTHQPSVWIEHPDIPRAVKLTLNLIPKPVAVCTRELRFDPSVIDQETQEKLVSYTNKLVLEGRATQLAKRMIREFLEGEIAPSVAHVVARWPTLVLLTEPPSTRRWGSEFALNQLIEWQRKFRAVPDNLGRYQWSRAGADDLLWYERYKGAMRLVDSMLAMAKILPEAEDKAACKATLISWKPLPEDRDKPR